MELSRIDVSYLNLKQKIKTLARAFYIEWAQSSVLERTNPNLGEITISRVGWRHITRNDRFTERIIQSFHLLGAARKIIKEVKVPENFGHESSETVNGVTINQQYIGLRAMTFFPHRYESSVTVVLKKQVKINVVDGTILDTKIWFLTVYESRRGKNRI